MKMSLVSCISKKSRYTIPLVLFLVSVLVYSYNLEGQPRHGDEINYLGWAGNYIHLINSGDLANSCLVSIDNCNLLYHIPAHGATYSPLRMILIGIPLSLEHLDTGDYYDWSCYWFTCYNFHNAPTIQQMAAGRALSPVFGALAVVVAFLIGKILFNRNVGIIFSILFMFYNLWVWYSRTIMTEVHYIFFSMLALLLLLYSFRTGHLRIKYLVSSGIAFGCAFTSKLLSVEFSILFASIILFYGLSQRLPVDKRHVLKTSLIIGAFFLIAILGFLLTEPGFYKNPIHQIVAIKSDMDNYNRDVWFIAYPTIQGLEPTRMLSLFHYTLFPSPIEHTIPGAYPNSTFKIWWNNPPTNSSIPLTVFFFVGIGYIINKIRKLKDCIPEALVLIWFVSTFFTTLMIARDLSLERYMLPFLISIIIIASYGFWSFTRHITNKKIQISFIACALFAHAVTSMSYWQKIYFSPGTFWTNPLPYGTLQESLANPFTLIVNAIFVAFFACMILIWSKNKTKVAT
ncbi:Putative glycosyltransferase of PMT family [Nitrosotalea devaniterrae]|uniref:Glycosyltransferase of PMT family n=1 Tax=Nitrosotalea devaniterrae TaxID=1078905 RepID=A0A128A4A0_9ARCH|nr:Putative glycosyltransferase of PMT family [Candidatus Nitrosotalea devanaterra]